MENKELEAVTFNNIDYAILDEIDNFIYTVNVNNANDIKIFKTKIEEDNEIFFYPHAFFDEKTQLLYIAYENSKQFWLKKIPFEDIS